jgi:superfamily I DNA/RNA helicase/mRNA-degrading endonuclease RelE of RelBE toxin-antitoxin system
MSESIQVAIGDDFLRSYADLPKNRQGKVTDFVMKFRMSPTSSGINYEKIHAAKDKNLRSVRIDQEYRAIVHKPEQGNTFILLWVDHHDQAYDWAKRKLLKIHPSTGGLQVINMESVEGRVSTSEEVNKPAKPEKKAPLFEGFRDRELIKLGVPEELLTLTFAIASEDELELEESNFPPEAFEALVMLAAGYSVEDAFREQEVAEKEEVDPEDFALALQNEDSKRRFALVTEDLELQKLLNAPLEQWRVFLHPSQRRLATKTARGPVRVLGGAGTGKTVVAMHRAKWLAEKLEAGTGKNILFTTYTRNLALDIEQNLAKICSPELMQRIQVVNFDAWIWQILKKRFKYQYLHVSQNVKAEIWKDITEAKPMDLNLPDTFFREEWEKIILPLGIETLDEYLTTPRTGRGTRLSRKQRKAVWSLIEEYREELGDRNLKEYQDAYRELGVFLKEDRTNLGITAAVVDEAQDMGHQAFCLLRQVVAEGENDLFIVGDAHQRIYDKKKVVLGRCGVKIIGRSHRLKINYRTTDEIRKWAVSILKGVQVDDLDGGEDTIKGYRALVHGPSPEVQHFDNLDDELAYITKQIKTRCEDRASLATVCISLRTNKLVEDYQKKLEDRDIKTHLLERNKPDDPRKEGVRICTMHRVKGLEFDHVILPSLNQGVLPTHHINDSQDPVEKNQAIEREKCLLHVAATRARKTLMVTSYGQKSEFLGD